MDFCNKLVFVLGKPSLMFAGEAKSLPEWSTFQVVYSRVGFGLNRKH